MKKIKIVFHSLAVCIMLALNVAVLLPAPVMAQDSSVSNCTSGDPLCIPSPPSSFGGLAKQKDLGSLIRLVLDILLALTGVVAVVWMVIGGYQYMTAGGNEEQVEKGRRALTNSIIGLAVIILSYAIVQVVANFLTGKSGFGF